MFINLIKKACALLTPIPVIIFICITISLPLAIGKNALQFNKQGDAAIFEQLLDNLYNHQSFNSSIFANTQHYLDLKLFKRNELELAQDTIEVPGHGERNMLSFHAYYILLPLSFFEHFFNAGILTTFIQIFCFVSVPIAAYFFVAKETGRIFPAAMVTALIMLNPNWFSGIQGQFYPDRIYLFAGFSLCLMLYYKSSWVLFSSFIIVSTLINERAGLINGLVIGAYLVTHQKANFTKYQAFLYAVGILSIGYFYIEKNFYIENNYYKGLVPTSLEEITNRLHRPHFVSDIVTNLRNNFPLIALGLAYPRFGLIALACLAPNFIGKLDAPKINWLTHYHSYYFPILAFAACVGAIKLCKYSESPKLPHAILTLIFLFSFTEQQFLNANKQDIRPLDYAKTFSYSAYLSLTGQETGSALIAHREGYFSPTDLVSTTELGMSILRGYSDITVFPLGLDQANAILAPCPTLKQNIALLETIKNKGFTEFVPASPQLLAAIDYCIMKKLTNLNAN